MNVLRLYQNAYRSRPLIIHAVETGLIMASADMVSQIIVEARTFDSLDSGRALRFGGIGLLVVAPARVGWYRFLEKKLPGCSTSTVLQKLALDQACFAPCLVLAIVSSVSYTSGMQTDQIIDKLHSSFKDIMLNNWKVWPCVQLCNFYLVPAHLRMTTVQIVAFIWNIYLSWKANVNKSDL
ncbi:hypothetical protein ONE63_001217 [Megalurothrips usitatus]|uniref:Mitochondrial inner membrane protein Mpv17 n=1 Tax=Megalurothrips usitatus TaxID=439358 RepID=A0AAV7XI82_9NEOP|nr:hypothetical protein ONE63_001217 [Megalurothrips usitatus]